MKSFLKAEPQFRNGYKDPKRMEDIHNLPCAVCVKHSLQQQSRTEAHHLIGYGMGKKASDLYTAAICFCHHGPDVAGVAIHSTGIKTWEAKYGTQEEFLEMTNKMLATLNQEN